MNKNQKIIALATLAAMTAGGVLWWRHQGPAETAVNWRVYQKQSRSIASRPPLPTERQALKSAEKNLTLPRPHDAVVLENRLVSGHDNHPRWREKKPDVTMLNRPGDWQKLLGEHLMRYQTQDIAVMVRPVESYILAAGQQGRYAEEVYVAYMQGERVLSSYRAMVDSQSGEVIKTWGKTVTENLAKRTPRLTPGD